MTKNKKGYEIPKLKILQVNLEEVICMSFSVNENEAFDFDKDGVNFDI